MLRALKHVGTGALVIALLLGVASCTPPLRGSLSLSVDDRGQTLVGICHSTEVARINVYFVEAGKDQERKILQAQGDGVPVGKGDTWVLGTKTPGFDTDYSELIPLGGHSAAGSKVYLVFTGTESNYDLTGDFEIPADGLQEGLWLFPDGSLSERVCGRYDDEHARLQERRGNDSNDDQ